MSELEPIFIANSRIDGCPIFKVSKDFIIPYNAIIVNSIPEQPKYTYYKIKWNIQ